MDKENKYLIQSNYFTQAVFNLEKETYKDIVYFIQSKINFYGDPIKTITFTIEEYAKFKGIEANNIYSIVEFLEIFKDLINVHGAFFNNLTNQVTMFNLIQDASIDQESNYRITVTLSDWSEKFFFKDAMHKYVEGILKTNELNIT